MPNDLETKIRSTRLPVPIWRRIQEYQRQRMLPTERDALRELVERQLDTAGVVDPGATHPPRADAGRGEG